MAGSHAWANNITRRQVMVRIISVDSYDMTWTYLSLYVNPPSKIRFAVISSDDMFVSHENMQTNRHIYQQNVNGIWVFNNMTFNVPEQYKTDVSV